jgi:hypothetical protein
MDNSANDVNATMKRMLGNEEASICEGLILAMSPHEHIEN